MGGEMRRAVPARLPDLAELLKLTGIENYIQLQSDSAK